MGHTEKVKASSLFARIDEVDKSLSGVLHRFYSNSQLFFFQIAPLYLRLELGKFDYIVAIAAMIFGVVGMPFIVIVLWWYYSINEALLAWLVCKNFCKTKKP